MGFIQADRKQLGLLGYSIDEFVEENSQARFIVKIVESLDTRELYSRYSDQGADAIDPKVQLATWFLGYCESVTSTRKLEYNCRKNLDFIYVSGNLKPDHTSLSRFRKQHIDLIPSYFIQIVRKAISLGLSDFKEITVDGTKLPSVSSKRKSMRADALEEKIKQAEKDISAYLSESQNEDAGLTKLLREKEKLEKAKEVLQERRADMKDKFHQSHQVNIEEPDAPMQRLGGSRGSFSGYNAQISTDTKTQLIVGSRVVQDRNDNKQFVHQYENAERVLGTDKQRQYIADSGYNSHQTINDVYKKGINAYIADRTKSRETKEKIRDGKKLSKEDLTYDAKADCYICPEGRKLVYVKTENNRSFRGKKYKTESCVNCRIRHLCLGKNNKSGVREIRRDDREKYVEMMRQKMRGKPGKEKMFTRKTTVETVIGNIKSNMGYSRFRLKGLTAVNGEFMLMCIGHNLNKLFRFNGGFNFSPIFYLSKIIYRIKRKFEKIFLSKVANVTLQINLSQ